MNNDLNSFHAWAQSRGISYNLNFSEGEQVFEVETISPAPAECFYMKRCYALERFKERWEENLNKK